MCMLNLLELVHGKWVAVGLVAITCTSGGPANFVVNAVGRVCII